MQNSLPYQVPKVEPKVNAVIQFVFYYRLVVVMLMLCTSVIIGLIVWKQSNEVDKLKNFSLVVTGGSIFIGIFYNILNYENTYRKNHRDMKSSKDSLSFNVACEFNKPQMVENLKGTKALFETHQHLINQNKAQEFFDLLEKDEIGRFALVSIFNYFECLAIGIDQGIIDECFSKKFFKSLIISYYHDYNFFIEYKRKLNKTPTSWEHFTKLAQKWAAE
ncbi:DUF4760 domain-containing protein [Pinibacter aurantiacus]|uniref:DUF4760 domain-containing protein n=1 Tax=Pinibacter aurantiacus TaxID=2851599 RepID=A0A9E2SBW0_9BACT|nr:DUF4760 domain-containing protein [Pinibacter aurantiacus]MBV4358274.1 DUF4760 domain-containing protein [Pinibacter aurantiacus]